MDEVRFDPKLQPPDRQAGQATSPNRTEWCSVVATDGARQTVQAKRRRKDRLHAFDRRPRSPHVDQKAAVAIRDRQRMDAPAVQRSEPAFEIGGPLVVCRRDRCERTPLMNRSAPALDRCNQSHLLENVADRRGRRPARLGSSVLELCQQLPRPQMRKSPAQGDNCILQLGCGRVRTMQRTHAADPVFCAARPRQPIHRCRMLQATTELPCSRTPELGFNPSSALYSRPKSDDIRLRRASAQAAPTRPVVRSARRRRASREVNCIGSITAPRLRIAVAPLSSLQEAGSLTWNGPL